MMMERDSLQDLAGDSLAAMISLVKEHTGIAMDERKGVLLQGRLRPRIRALGLTGYRAYIDHVKKGAEVPAFISLVTTNDTAFFRTPVVWDYLAGEFLPAWLREQGSQTLRIWSAAAATGEEAYSLAMLCVDFQQAHPAFRFRIDATDISPDALAVAQAARYQGRSVQRFASDRAAQFARHMVADESSWAVRPDVTRHVRFASHHLLRERSRSTYDLILLRNVLMYFTDDDQLRALNGVSAALAPQGRLVLGEQDSLTRLAVPFRLVKPHVYEKVA
jgi:chemotaxis protein methyltransferase CheR